jgi:hypothetical protein
MPFKKIIAVYGDKQKMQNYLLLQQVAHIVTTELSSF